MGFNFHRAALSEFRKGSASVALGVLLGAAAQVDNTDLSNGALAELTAYFVQLRLVGQLLKPTRYPRPFKIKQNRRHFAPPSNPLTVSL